MSATTAVFACGVDFPLQLLDDRAGSLEHVPTNSFLYEASHFIKDVDTLEAVETDEDYYRAEPNDVLPAIQFQTSDLTPEQAAIVLKMRASSNGDDAFEIGAGLPMAVRLYNAGAVDYALGFHAEDSGAVWARAEARFQSILALPKAEGDIRAAWAAYMIGRMNVFNYYFSGDTIAQQAFALTRSRVLNGASDKWGLAVASYGEEALTYLVADRSPCVWYAFLHQDSTWGEVEKCVDNISSANLIKAISLYAEQAARNSYSGVNSLRFIAAWTLERADRIAKVIDDPIAQKNLVAYALARFGDGFDPQIEDEVFNNSSDISATGLAAHETLSTSRQKLDALMAAILRLPSDRVVEKDRLAALAYRIGNYEFAKRLVDEQNSALADWIRAKLAIRDGDIAAAATAYAKASRFFPALDESISSESASLMKAEQGVLTLARGQYVDAMDQLYVAAVKEIDRGFWENGYYHDAAYIAERILTLDELKSYVDTHVSPSQRPSTVPDIKNPDEFYKWWTQQPEDPADDLRSLLARRLVREGRLAEAGSYFPAEDDARNMQVSYDGRDYIIEPPKPRRQWLAEYMGALNDSKDAWTDIGSAEALFKASIIARERGMEIMGYEQGPDFTAFGGSYHDGIGHNPMSGPYVTAGERSRFVASITQPSRF